MGGRCAGRAQDGSGDGHMSQTTPALVVKATACVPRRADHGRTLLAARLAPSFPRVREIVCQQKRAVVFLVTHLSAEASHLTTVLEACDRSSVCFSITALSVALRANE